MQNTSDKPEFSTVSDPGCTLPTDNCPLVIGLTGGIGSGKSTVAGCFSELGVPVIDTDTIARELVEPGQPALRQVIICFGKQILDANGTLDRSRLRAEIFSNPAERRKLEQILHPQIRAEMQRQLQRIDAPYCIVEIPLLLESGWTNDVDRILVVDTPRPLQIERTLQRSGINKEQVEQIIAAQMERNERLAAADDIIINDGDLSQLRQQVEQLDQFYRKETNR